MKKAIAVLHNDDNIYGEIIFSQKFNNDNVKVDIYFENLPHNSIHGLHIHEFGDMRYFCESLGSHYNPYDRPHGNRKNHGRYIHTGDLINNIYSDSYGFYHNIYYDNLINLFGKFSIIGRSVVLHQDIDDLGLGQNKESLKTGNAGKRIACGVIGIYNENLYS